MKFLHALARLVLIASIGGLLPQALVRADGPGRGVESVGRHVSGIELIRTGRSLKGIVLTRDGLRPETGARSHSAGSGLPTATPALASLDDGRSLVEQNLVPHSSLSSSSSRLRGPPAL